MQESERRLTPPQARKLLDGIRSEVTSQGASVLYRDSLAPGTTSEQRLDMWAYLETPSMRKELKLLLDRTKQSLLLMRLVSQHESVETIIENVIAAINERATHVEFTQIPQIDSSLNRWTKEQFQQEMHIIQLYVFKAFLSMMRIFAVKQVNALMDKGFTLEDARNVINNKVIQIILKENQRSAT